jgi:hypothetical protein
MRLKLRATGATRRGIVDSMDPSTDVELLAKLLVARLVVLCGRSEAARILEQVVAELKMAGPRERRPPALDE